MTSRPLEDALAEAYRSWSRTGAARVPGFDAGEFDPATLGRRLAELDRVSQRCVIAKTQAAWLRQAIE